MPENVQKAIEVAESKQRYSQFYYRLQSLNDNLIIYNQMIGKVESPSDKVTQKPKRKFVSFSIAQSPKKATPTKTIKRKETGNIQFLVSHENEPAELKMSSGNQLLDSFSPLKYLIESIKS